MNVASIMSKHTITVGATATFSELWKSIFKHSINALLVVDKKQKLIGIVTREDLLERLYPDYQEMFANEWDLPDFEAMEKKVLELSALRAVDIMCKRVIFTRETTPIMRALSRMIVRRLNQLPVLNDRDILVGIVTKGDIFASVFKKNQKEMAKAEKRSRRK